jgi:hypothetical protein
MQKISKVYKVNSSFEGVGRKPITINLCLRGGLGWWFGSLGIDGFVNLEKTKNIKPCKQ